MDANERLNFIDSFITTKVEEALMNLVGDEFNDIVDYHVHFGLCKHPLVVFKCEDGSGLGFELPLRFDVLGGFDAYVLITFHTALAQHGREGMKVDSSLV